MPSEEITDYRWQKSSYSNGGNNGACVEVASAPDGSGTAVRDSKLGNRSPILTTSHEGWRSFLDVARHHAQGRH